MRLKKKHLAGIVIGLIIVGLVLLSPSKQTSIFNTEYVKIDGVGDPAVANYLAFTIYFNVDKLYQIEPKCAGWEVEITDPSGYTSVTRAYDTYITRSFKKVILYLVKLEGEHVVKASMLIKELYRAPVATTTYSGGGGGDYKFSLIDQAVQGDWIYYSAVKFVAYKTLTGDTDTPIIITNPPGPPLDAVSAFTLPVILLALPLYYYKRRKDND